MIKKIIYYYIKHNPVHSTNGTGKKAPAKVPAKKKKAGAR
jgi:hypothetical protein